MIGLNRRRMMGGKSLPYDAEIEYLESDGTQYIDTGYYPSEISNLTCDFIPVQINRRRLFGTRNAAPTTHYDVTLYDINAWGALTRVGADGNVAVKPLARGLRYTLKIDAIAHRVYLNEAAFNLRNYTTFQCTHSLLLFALHDYDGTIGDLGSVKLYSLYIEENGQKVIDMIPVRIGTTGYMYDKVSGQLFGNSGTGKFILGADK